MAGEEAGRRAVARGGGKGTTWRTAIDQCGGESSDQLSVDSQVLPLANLKHVGDFPIDVKVSTGLIIW